MKRIISTIAISLSLTCMLCFAIPKTANAMCYVTYELSCGTLSNVLTSCDFTLRELQNIAKSLDAMLC